jgi:ribose-phosphate pyrophosphokinase
MNRMLLPFPLQPEMAERMATPLQARMGRLDWRGFPDGESLITFDHAREGTDSAMGGKLADPGAKRVRRSSDRVEAPDLP